MLFAYTATDPSGKKVTGTLEATTKEAVLGSLHHQQLRPLAVKAASSKQANGGGFLQRKKVSSRDLVVFTRQLSTMVSAGVPLNRAMNTLQAQASGKYFKEVVGSVSKDIQAGLPLAEAFDKFPIVFSDVYINMVRAGEAGGILDSILKRLATQMEQEASMRKKVKSAMTYPSVIMSVTVVAFFGIMIFIIPKIGAIMKDLGGENAKLPVYTLAMLNVSDFLRHYAIPIVVLLAVTAFFVRRYIRTPKGKFALHKLLLRIPVVKTIITKVAIARFSRTFASLMSAGVGVLEALEVTGRAIGNKVIEKELIDAAKQVKNGKSLSEPLAASIHFPPIVSQMIAVGEETGKMDEILIKVADFYEEEVAAVIDGLSSIIEPVMIIILGAVVGLIAASVMGPIANLSKNIGTN